MVTIYYESVLIISILLTIIYLLIWNKHFDINISIIFLIIPITNLAYLFNHMATDYGSFVYSQKMIYFGGCFLPFFILMSVFNLCDIKINRYVKTLAFVIIVLLYASVLTIGHSEMFYKSIEVTQTADGLEVIKEYGVMHAIYYIVLSFYFVVGISAIIVSLLRTRYISNITLFLLIFPEVLSIVAFFGGKMLGKDFEIVPVAFVIAQFIYLLITRRMSLYNIGDAVIDSMVQTGEIGFISISSSMKYLGSNKTARKIIPELKELYVDQKIEGLPQFEKTINHWLKHFMADDNSYKDFYVIRNSEDEDDFESYIVEVKYINDDRKKRGYQIFLNDDTQNQKYIELLNRYNSDLEDEVEEKTRHIVEMHDNLILGMATMVESRDNSTGGHIRRTSAGVRILMKEIMKENELGVSEEFVKDIIKAAPMHDIGKIAVDDAILRKPGRFTDEEYEVMKTHAAEGARIIHDILMDTDDEAFKVIAENVAHYHHERWDGSGYPEGLKGEEIPLEARIMAIADVYDALVSKRVYKEKMSFEDADRIIMEGMGKHFDKKLEKYYVSARPKLEDYYSNTEC